MEVFDRLAPAAKGRLSSAIELGKKDELGSWVSNTLRDLNAFATNSEQKKVLSSSTNFLFSPRTIDPTSDGLCLNANLTKS